MKWKELDLVCKGLEVLIEQEKGLATHHDPKVWVDSQESINKLEELTDFLYFVLYDRPIAFIEGDACGIANGFDKFINEGDGVE